MTPYQKIMRAADRGTGLRLNAEEVSQLAIDGAIQSIAWNDDDNDVERRNELKAERAAHQPAGDRNG